jgi:hypothetical protein
MSSAHATSYLAPQARAFLNSASDCGACDAKSVVDASMLSLPW